ncbi:DUF3084 domain-containing protein [Trichothermofontia sichuanensis B231]|uniref:DUF3084 domain-containing protein n=1 Tax=Trichothermofontia sichuanensis TaxID=3045816 RepID=UPI002246ECF3|nr:DUF3084 domain-containing protein [Trichothermofontia sichuanensis]UZQ53253.1 DUF3084 domain-containing protein [Trichothermofontia sichuanensis B231]
MTIGVILVLCVLVLGGVIATIGDRLGSKVGKARLSLFKLRPRQTAVLITIITGTVISASTLALLLATSEPLRRGLFEYDDIQKNLRTARREMREAMDQKALIQGELEQARRDQAAAQQRLHQINQSLQQAIANQNRTEAQLKSTEEQLASISQDFQAAQVQLQTITRQTQGLRQEIKQLQAEREQLVQQRDEVKAQIAQRDAEIAAKEVNIARKDEQINQRDRVIAQQEARLKELEDQRRFIEQQVTRLLQTYRELRQGEVVLVRGQVLTSALVQVSNATEAQNAVDQLLREANRFVIRVTRPGSNGQKEEQVVQIPNAMVRELIATLANNQPYYVRIVSAGNYVVGEPAVFVSPEVALNQKILAQGTLITSIDIDPTTMSDAEIRERLDQLLRAAQFIIRQRGVLAMLPLDMVALVQFVQSLEAANQPLEVQVVATQDIYTAGPLSFEVRAMRGNEVVIRAQVVDR